MEGKGREEKKIRKCRHQGGQEMIARGKVSPMENA